MAIKDEATLRKDAEKAQTKLDKARAKFRADVNSDEAGRELLAAREESSKALRALWAACPEEKPPSQHIGT